MTCNDCKERPRYPHWVTIEQPAGSKDAAGHVDLTNDANWETVGKIKVRFITRGGREGRVFDQIQAEVTHLIATPSTNRSRTQITPKRRLRMGTRKFNITSAYDLNEAKEEVRIEAVEAK